MASEALEQMLSSVPRMGQEDRAYQTLDVYTSGLSQMYTGPMGPPGGPMNLPMGGIGPEPLKPLDRGYGDMSPNNSDLLGNTYELDNGFQLGERLDFSGHGGTEPHINYDLLKPNNKLLDNGPDLLGPNHQIDLFKP